MFKIEEKIVTLANRYSNLFSFPSLDYFLIKYRYKICPFDNIAPYINGNSVLDIGCGFSFLLYIANKLCHVPNLYGIDCNERKIQKAEKLLKLHTTANNIKLYCCKDSSRWPKKTFDVITMIDVLHHVAPKDQKRYLVEALKRTAPNGTFIYKDMANKPLIMNIMNRLHDLVIARQWIHYLDIKEVERVFLENGFQAVARKKKILFWYSHEMIVFQHRHSFKG